MGFHNSYTSMDNLCQHARNMFARAADVNVSIQVRRRCRKSSTTSRPSTGRQDRKRPLIMAKACSMVLWAVRTEKERLHPRALQCFGYHRRLVDGRVVKKQMLVAGEIHGSHKISHVGTVDGPGFHTSTDDPVVADGHDQRPAPLFVRGGLHRQTLPPRAVPVHRFHIEPKGRFIDGIDLRRIDGHGARSVGGSLIVQSGLFDTLKRAFPGVSQRSQRHACRALGNRSA